MNKPKKVKALPFLAAAALTVFSCSSFAILGGVSAAQLQRTQVRLNRLDYGRTNNGGRICAQPTTVGVENRIVVTFPTNNATDYSLSSTLTDWAATGVADASISATAWPGLSSTAATSVSGKTVTWTMSTGDPVVGTMYCFNFAGGLTNANNNTETVGGTVVTQTSGSAEIDRGSFSIGLANPANTGDQIAISNVTVPPIFTFALSGNTDSFAQNLSLTTPRYTSGRQVTISTNAANGYNVWAKNSWDPGAGAGNGRGALRSATANAYLFANAAVGSASRTISAGSQDYGMGVTVTTNGSATTAATTAYEGSSSKIGTLDPINFQPIAGATQPTASDVLNLFEGASMSTTTKAASDYADSITIVGAGMF